MKNQDIYISIDPITYKNSKANLLSTQIDLLNIMKHLQNLKKIKREKRKLKKELHQLFQELLKDLENLENHLPNSEIPKQLQAKINTKRTKEIETPKPKIQKQPKPAETIDKTIEQELREIQNKLRALNASR